MTGRREVLLLVVIALAVYGMLLLPGRAPTSRYSDFIPYGWPTKQVLYDSVHAGRGLPLWRSDQLSGSEAVTQPQALYTYPLDFLYWILPPLWAVGPTFWLDLLVAALGCVALGRELGLGGRARLVMGVAGLVSFKLLLVVYVGWTPVVPALSLLPWIAVASLALARRPDLSRALGLAAAVALALLAGTLQYAYYLALFLAPYLAYRLVRLLRAGDRRGAARMAGLGLAAGVLGFMIAAHLWLPILSDLPLLSRKSLDYDFFLGGTPVALHARDLATLVAPEWLGTPRVGWDQIALWEKAMYFGWVPLGLAVLAIAVRWRRPAVRWIAVVAGISALLAFGTPVLRALYDWLPGYALFRCPARILFVTSYSVIALAGFGVEAIDEYLRVRSPRAARLVVAALVAFMAAEGLVRAHEYLDMRPHPELVPALPVVEKLDRGSGPYRLVRLGGKPPRFVWGVAAGLEFVAGYDPYNLEHYRRYLERVGRVQWPEPFSQVYLMDIRRPDMLDALDVRYALVYQHFTGLPGGWQKVAAWRKHPAYRFQWGRLTLPLTLYERTDPVARAFLVDHVVRVDDAEGAWRAIAAENLRLAAVVEADPGRELRNTISPGDRLDVVEEQPGRLLLRSRTAGERFAVVSEVWHPGWSAAIDGAPARLHRTDGALLGLALPPGAHDIELHFTPSHWHLGLALGAAGLALWIALALYAWVFARPDRRPLRRRRQTAAPGRPGGRGPAPSA